MKGRSGRHQYVLCLFLGRTAAAVASRTSFPPLQKEKKRESWKEEKAKSHCSKREGSAWVRAAPASLGRLSCKDNTSAGKGSKAIFSPPKSLNQS